MEKVTIRILADRLQLSAATVSKALADSHEISEVTKQRVLALAAALNYTPNPYASGLRRKKSKTIAVVLPEVADSFFARVINGIEMVAQEKGYHVLIRLTHENFEKEKAILKDLGGGRADGILLSVSSATADSGHVKELMEKGIPVVFFDRVLGDIKAAKVVTDDFESARKATRHLIAGGCKKIAILTVSTALSISQQRTEGFKQALLDEGLLFKEEDIIQCGNEPDLIQTQIRQLLQGPIPPDGIIATVEKLVPEIYQACHDLGLAIPGRVKVLGFSNLPTAMFMAPSLTTITQPALEMGQAATTLLVRALENKNPGLPDQYRMIPSELIIRASTGN